MENKKEYLIRIVRNQYGYVKVRADDEEAAKATVEKMAQSKLLKYYKHEYEFISVGKVINNSDD